MSTETQPFLCPDLDDPVLAEADHQAVFAAFLARTPVDPVIGARVHARAMRIREENFRKHGLMDDATFQSIIDEDDDE